MWDSGRAINSGGVISGSIAIALTKLFSKFGAVLILIVAAALLILASVNKTVADIVDAYKKRERREYVYPPEPENSPQPDIPHTTDAPPTSARRTKPDKHRRKKTDIDIPMDDTSSAPAPETPAAAPAAMVQPSAGQEGKKPPEEFFITGVESANGIDRRSVEPLGESDMFIDRELPTLSEDEEDIPLDIPFMESPVRQAPKPTHRKPAKLPSGKVKPPEPIAPDSRRKEPFDVMQEDRKPPHTEEQVILPPDGPGSHTPAPSAQTSSVTGASDIDMYLPGEPEKPKTAKIEPLDIDTPAVDSAGYIYPPVELLSPNMSSVTIGEQEDTYETSQRLESSFRSFGVNVKIIGHTRGPAVTRYEAELEPGVKLSKITNLANDIALSIGASGVRIAAMPNKISTVGIEVPNKKVSSVYLREIIESDNFKNSKSKLTFAIGRSIAGDAIVGNVSKLPHLLVAGTTGSGKSVCLNSIILSILYKAKPDEVRFIMVDPKMVEFKVYNGIPHLLIPVVTDAKKAAGALQWAVVEMLKRYRLFSETTARELEGYNDYVRKLDDPDRPPLPQIVVFIDELADLMMIAKKEVEDSIVRIAQMGRAAGMHLVVATQSPRADVITGLMKANIPSRIALKVSNSLESRIILDAGGNADKLVGNGDMLYAPIGSDKPLRVQGSWVSDEEREAVIDFVKKQGETDYSQEVIAEIENNVAKDEPSADSESSSGSAGDYD
ncbi:MAG: DNA translocase FtsK, partial [Oscillospiraceae bacterium]|nr:DNA translocase FtsK [Oscillospiraceae bacterium]